MTKTEIKTIFEEIYPSTDITIDKYTDKEICITVSQMYNHIKVSFNILKEIAKKMKCKEINLETSHSDGCETCDYGSSYEVSFLCYNFK